VEADNNKKSVFNVEDHHRYNIFDYLESPSDFQNHKVNSTDRATCIQYNPTTSSLYNNNN
jgi:hypothetical protein